MSIFHQRMLKPCSDIYYFQLIPTNLLYHSKQEDISSDQEQFPELVTFKLYKQEILCDQVKKPIPVTRVDEKVYISRAYLNFNVSLKQQDKIVEFEVKIIGVDRGEKQLDSSQTMRKERKGGQGGASSKKQYKYYYDIGSCTLKISKYISQLQEKNANEFHQICQINENCSFNFQLYLARSRFTLERFVKHTLETRKKDDRKVLIELPKYDELEQFYMMNMREDKTSEISQNFFVHTGGQHRFISADKRFLKKGDKKLIVRNRSPKKEYLLSEEQYIIRNIKSADKSYLNIKQSEGSISKIKENFTKRQSKNENLPNINQQVTLNQNNFLKVGQQVNKAKVDASLRITQKTNHNEDEPKTPKSLMKSKGQSKSQSKSKLKNNNTTPTKPNQNKAPLKQEHQQIHSHRNQKQKKVPINLNLGSLISNKMFIACFMIVSVIMLLTVMTPSRKV